MNKTSIRMTYGFNAVEKLYSGDITVTTEGAMHAEEFERTAFARMMSRLASHIRTAEDVDVTLVRAEKSHSEYKLDRQTIELLRTDPVSAIRSMSHPDTTVRVLDEDRAVERPGLQIGHATLASSFGDEIFCSFTHGEVECPGCGRWSELKLQDQGDVQFDCMQCSTSLKGRVTGPWFVIKTSNLIDTPGFQMSSFYLPRKWNVSGPWVHCNDLRERYENFKKERDAT